LATKLDFFSSLVGCGL